MRRRDPKGGTMRERRVFLWLPEVLPVSGDVGAQREWRWLEWAFVHERWYPPQPCYGGEWRAVRWGDGAAVGETWR